MGTAPSIRAPPRGIPGAGKVADIHQRPRPGRGEGTDDRCTDRTPQMGERQPSLNGVDHRSQIREFLTSRRARISPQQAGLSSYGTRRVPGLRRSEVAQLAGVSVEYYARLERGDLSGVSDQ